MFEGRAVYRSLRQQVGLGLKSRYRHREHLMRYLHTMIRAANLDDTLDFFIDMLGLVEAYRYDNDAGRFGGRNFGHLAYQVDDIYATCQQLLDKGVTLNRPPRDGRMAFIRSPDGISQSMENIGEW